MFAHPSFSSAVVQTPQAGERGRDVAREDPRPGREHSRKIDVPRRCPWCDAPVMLTPDGRMLNDGRQARGEVHRCAK